MGPGFIVTCPASPVFLAGAKSDGEGTDFNRLRQLNDNMPPCPTDQCTNKSKEGQSQHRLWSTLEGPRPIKHRIKTGPGGEVDFSEI
jgi:hypothetical protein